jgi:hypothetical protein
MPELDEVPAAPRDLVAADRANEVPRADGELVDGPRRRPKEQETQRPQGLRQTVGAGLDERLIAAQLLARGSKHRFELLVRHPHVVLRKERLGRDAGPHAQRLERAARELVANEGCERPEDPDVEVLGGFVVLGRAGERVGFGVSRGHVRTLPLDSQRHLSPTIERPPRYSRTFTPAGLRARGQAPALPPRDVGSPRTDGCAGGQRGPSLQPGTAAAAFETLAQPRPAIARDEPGGTG